MQNFVGVSTHTTVEELSNQLAVNMRKAVLEYIKLAGSLPENIFIFRDGVGDVNTVHEEYAIIVARTSFKLYA